MQSKAIRDVSWCPFRRRLWSHRQGGTADVPPRVKVFVRQPLAIVGRQPVGLRQEPGPGHPVGLRSEHPLIHLGADVQFVGLLTITKRFLLIITGDQLLM